MHLLSGPSVLNPSSNKQLVLSMLPTYCCCAAFKVFVCFPTQSLAVFRRHFVKKMYNSSPVSMVLKSVNLSPNTPLLPSLFIYYLSLHWDYYEIYPFILNFWLSFMKKFILICFNVLNYHFFIFRRSVNIVWIPKSATFGIILVFVTCELVRNVLLIIRGREILESQIVLLMKSKTSLVVMPPPGSSTPASRLVAVLQVSLQSWTPDQTKQTNN